MPNFLRISLSSIASRAQRSCPSTKTWPLSGRTSPMRCLSRTLFPVPEGPTMTSDSPAAIDRLIPSRTGRPPNDLWRSSTLSFPAGEDAVAEVLAGALIEQPRQEEVHQQDREAGGDDGLRRRAPDALRASL